MAPPTLLIFDIDATLLVPGAYHSHSEIRGALYDPTLLTPFFNNPDYQVALASFNNEPDPVGTPFGGRRLGRIILDLQHPKGDSRGCVEDEFIQSWMHPTLDHIDQYGKMKHINFICYAYLKKYGARAPSIVFYDDYAPNVYGATKLGIHSFWVKHGLTKHTINSFGRIGHKIHFTTFNKLPSSVHVEGLYKELDIPNTPIRYTLYLSADKGAAQNLYDEFIDQLIRAGIMIQILYSDI